MRECYCSFRVIEANTRVRTFGLSFWYSLKMYMSFQISSPETLIV